MYILGFNGGTDLIGESSSFSEKYYYHDSSAVLLKDGKVVYAIEEERLNRIKHTSKFPILAIKECLAAENITFEDLTAIAYFETYMDDWIRYRIVTEGNEPVVKSSAEFLQQQFKKAFGVEIKTTKFRFIHHHLAHAMSAYGISGFSDCLCITLDGMGDYSAGKIYNIKSGKFKELADIPVYNSLGGYYVNTIGFLGYNLFDEYKVMGLAPYGYPDRFRSLFAKFYKLGRTGTFEIEDLNVINKALFRAATPRRKGQQFSQENKDIAASLQESLEKIVFHILKYYAKKTSQKNLCLAGGVAHNSTLNGKILDSGMFENVVIQPAAHDAGCSIGSALQVYSKTKSSKTSVAINDVFLGTPLESNSDIARILTRWSPVLDFKLSSNIVDETATLLANNKVIGWVQGRSEFGPRALGNRSILADPRPEENKERINKMIKKREGYRPFAPSVIEERAGDFFEVNSKNSTTIKQLGYMLYVVHVNKKYQKKLGAITHVNGTARIQTVSKTSNSKYWELISKFGKLTGTPILLNTSFNNNAEPIVNSAEDSIVCFLTTELDYLIIGDYIATRKSNFKKALLKFNISLPDFATLHEVTFPYNDSDKKNYICVSYDKTYSTEISDSLVDIIKRCALGDSIEKVLNRLGVKKSDKFLFEIFELWSKRIIKLTPTK